MTASPKKKTSRKPHGEKQIIIFLFGVSLVLTLFLGILLAALTHLNIPDIRSVSHYQPQQTTFVLDRYGSIIEKIHAKHRIVVPLDRMAPLLPKAFIAAEDGRFFEHPGLDFFSAFRAFINNVRAHGKSQGGSTITQQVAKGLLLTPEKTYLRKFKEAILAWRIDRFLSKKEIIYIYLNHIYLGAGAYGVEAAAQTYFNKHASQLNLSEIALLAGLPQAPSRYSPLDHWKRAHARQRYVLNRMAADGYISEKDAQIAYNIHPPLHRLAAVSSPVNGYYIQEVRRRAERMLNRPVDSAGVRIYTNLDPAQQQKGQQVIAEGVRLISARSILTNSGAKPPEGALVGLDGCSGKVRAIVGGSGYTLTPFNRAVQARRPAGSVFKPFIYAAALEQGLSPQSTIRDEPLSITGTDNTVWRPKNFSNTYHGTVTLREALIHSYNIPAIKVMQRTGMKAVHTLAAAAGITAELPADLSLALGAADVSLLEMSGAYMVFVCEGAWTQPTLIDRITTHDGIELFRHSPRLDRVMTRKTALTVKRMLGQVIEEGTGKSAAGLAGVSGGKTGTSNDNRDAWFIGFHDSYLGGVWFGHDHNEPMGTTENGGRTAAPVWRAFMEDIN